MSIDNFYSGDEGYDENVLNSQKTTYIKYPNSNKIKHRSAGKNTIVGNQLSTIVSTGDFLPVASLFNGSENAELIKKRYDLFKNHWQGCEKRIKSVLYDHSLPLLGEIIDRINEVPVKPISQDNIIFIGSSFQKKISTTILLSGTNIANHLSLFKGLSDYVKTDHQNVKLISLESKDCTDLRTTLKLIAFGLYDYAEGDLNNMQLDFDLIREYCLDYYRRHEKSVLDAFSTKLRIVLLIKNLNTFSQAILEKVISILQKELHVIPFKLILNTASVSTDFLESTLSNSLRQKLDCNIIEVVHDSKLIMNKIADQVFLSSKIYLREGSVILGPKIIGSILIRHKDNLATIHSFINSLKYAFMMHFFSEPLAIFSEFSNAENINIFAEESSNTKRHDSKLVDTKYVRAIRQLPSFQNFVDSLINDSKSYDTERLKNMFRTLTNFEENVSEEESLQFIIEKFIPFAAFNFKNNTLNFLNFLEFFDILQDVIVDNQEFLMKKIQLSIFNKKFKKLSKLDAYYLILSNDPMYSRFVKEMFSSIASLLPHYLLIFKERMNDLITNTTLPPNSTLKGFYEELVTGILKDLEAFSKGGPYYSPIDIDNDGLKNISIQAKIKFEQTIEAFSELLNKHFFQEDMLSRSIFGTKRHNSISLKSKEDNTLNQNDNDFGRLTKMLNISRGFHKLNTTLLCEVFIVHNSILPAALFPAARKNLENALTNPDDYLKASAVDLEESSDDSSSDSEMDSAEECETNNNAVSKKHSSPSAHSIPQNSKNGKANIDDDVQMIDGNESEVINYEQGKEDEESDLEIKEIEPPKDLEDFDEDPKEEDTSDKKKKILKESDNEDSEIEEFGDDLINNTLLRLRKLNQPFIVEMFKLYREAPLNINIFDYYQSFKSILSKKHYLRLFLDATKNPQSDIVTRDSDVLDQIYRHLAILENLQRAQPRSDLHAELKNQVDEKWDKIVLAFFLEFLFDLQYIGVLKEGKRRIETLEKVVWKGL